jgi:hypothetical protein
VLLSYISDVPDVIFSDPTPPTSQPVLPSHSPSLFTLPAAPDPSQTMSSTSNMSDLSSSAMESDSADAARRSSRGKGKGK